MNRKTFIKKATGAALIGIPFYSVLSCSGSDEDPVPTPMDDKSCLENGTVGSISANHGHSIIVSKADVSAGVEKQYDISGNASHDHSVTVSEANFTSLASNQQISVTSTSGGGHTHSVTVSCV